MADKKISALTAASTPLAGTEVLPIVQGGATVKVAVSDLTAGRAVSATALTMTTGNLTPSTAAKGINFTANTPAAGMTSQLLNWYEEGTWTPTITTTSGTVTLDGTTCQYTRIGRVVHICGLISVVSVSSPAGNTFINGLPFAASYYSAVVASDVFAAKTKLYTSAASTSLIYAYWNNGQIGGDLTGTSKIVLGGSYTI